jgi:hypothetical protein
MPLVYGTPELWLQRAKESRYMAGLITDPEAHRAILEIAANYEKIAARARIQQFVTLDDSDRL